MIEDITSCKKFFVLSIIFLALLVLVPVVSAANFDNRIDKNIDRIGKAGYKDIEIRNSFGFGKKLWEGTLDENTDTCGIECSATQTITLYEKGSLVDDIIFERIYEDGRREEVEIKSYQIYVNGNHYELGTELEKGIYKVLLEGEKKNPNHTIDWIYITQGQVLKSWAVWGSSNIIDNLVAYWNLDESSGEAIDSLSLNNGTNNGAEQNVAGKINTAYDFIPSDYVDMGDFTISSDNISISAWVKFTNVAGQQIAVAKDDNVLGREFAFGISSGHIFFTAAALSSSNTGDTLLEVDTFYHIGVSFSSTNNTGYFYLNGQPDGFFTTTGNLANTNAPFNLGRRSYSGAENYLTGVIDEVGIWNVTKSDEDFKNLYSSNNGLPYPFEVPIILNSPANNYVSPINEIEFNATVIVAGATLTNMSLWHNGTGVWNRNQTEELTGNINTSILNSTFSDGIFLWSYEACASDGDCIFAKENRTLIIDTAAPIITINSPTSFVDYGYENKLETLSWSIIDLSLDSVWFSYNGTNTTLNGASNSTTFNLSTSPYNLTIWANDSLGNINSSYINWVYKIFENLQTYNTQTYETASETFTINVTANSSLTAANLIYNGTSSAGTQSGEIWSSTRDIPTGTGYGNKSFHWNFTYVGIQISSLVNEQNVSAITFGICNSTNNVPYINFTFLDEESLTALNASSDLAEWIYYIGSGDETKSLLYTNTSDNNNYTYCFSPADKTLHNTLTFQYSASGYPQRIHVRAADLTNATTEQTLYLLSTSDGIYSSIQTVNTIGSPVSNVVVQIERQFSGLWTLIGQDTTDSSGLVTFWVNPDYDHRLTFVKLGCVGTTQTIRPTQAAYTQTLNCGTASEEVYVSQIEGIRYTRGPRSGILSPGMTNFTYTLFAEQNNIVNASFQILNLTGGEILNSTDSTCTPSGCILSFLYNASNGENIKGRYYVDTGNGNILLEADAYWRLIKTSVSDTGTIKQFWQNFATLFDEWGAEEVDLNNKIEYSKFVFIFMFLAIILALFNKSIGNYDGQYPGAFAIGITIMIWMGSLAGGLTGQGFFYYSGLFGNTNVANFMNNYILAILSSFMAASIVLATARRNS